MLRIASLAFLLTRSTLTTHARAHVQVGMCQFHQFVPYARQIARPAKLPPATAPLASAHISSPTIPVSKLVPILFMEVAATV